MLNEHISSNNQVKGFTLIEALIYLVLLGTIVGAGSAAAYSLLESSAILRSNILLGQEGDFIIAKIGTATEAAQSILIPQTGTKALSARLQQWEGTDISFGLEGTSLLIWHGNGQAYPLNNPNVSVEKFLLANILQNGRSCLQTEFTIITLTSYGKTVRQEFKTQRCLLK